MKVNLEVTDTFGGEANYSWSIVRPMNTMNMKLLHVLVSCVWQRSSQG